MPGNVLLDTNLLVLLVVGMASEEYIAVHKNTQAYSKEAFSLLKLKLAEYDVLLSTPHILAETSNLCRQFKNPGKEQVSLALRALLHEATELTVNSRAASMRGEYIPLGITDTGIIDVQEQDVELLTDDLDLYVSSMVAGKRATNFSHLRDDFEI